MPGGKLQTNSILPVNSKPAATRFSPRSPLWSAGSGAAARWQRNLLTDDAGLIFEKMDRIRVSDHAHVPSFWRLWREGSCLNQR